MSYAPRMCVCVAVRRRCVSGSPVHSRPLRLGFALFATGRCVLGLPLRSRLAPRNCVAVCVMSFPSGSRLLRLGLAHSLLAVAAWVYSCAPDWRASLVFTEDQGWAYFGSAHRQHYKLADVTWIFLTTTRLGYHEKLCCRLAFTTVASCVSDLWSLHSCFGGEGTRRV